MVVEHPFAFEVCRRSVGPPLALDVTRRVVVEPQFAFQVSRLMVAEPPFAFEVRRRVVVPQYH